MNNIENTNDKIYEFNFEFVKGEYILLYSPIVISEKAYNSITDITIPENSILRIENITMGGSYKRNAVDIVFSFLVKKNKHLKLDYKIPNRITIDVYSLSGLKYSIIDEASIEAKLNALIRKAKVTTLLNDK